ncbi:MAG: helix-turn-helix protein, partial [Verrucomicrobiales bacterium]|nr:helix-turn-helix protein [Verrucomicrobiales bacterium]
MKARKALNLSIEDVAFETRIPHQRLRDMENDDLSNFANLTYAKGFLKLYSRHLNLDLHDYLDEFDTSVIAEAAGHEWSRTANIVGTLSPPSISPDQPRNPTTYLIMAAAAVIVGGIVWMFLKPHVRSQTANSPSPAVATSSNPSSRPPTAPASSAETGSPAVENSSQDTLARAAAPAPAAPIPVVESFPATTPPPKSSNPPPTVLPPPEPGSSVRRATIVDDQG